MFACVTRRYTEQRLRLQQRQRVNYAGQVVLSVLLLLGWPTRIVAVQDRSDTFLGLHSRVAEDAAVAVAQSFPGLSALDRQSSGTVTSDSPDSSGTGDDSPSALQPECQDELKRLGEELAACETAAQQKSADHAEAVTRSRTRRAETLDETEALRQQVERKETELSQLDAENDQLHEQLLEELRQVRPALQEDGLVAAIAVAERHRVAASGHADHDGEGSTAVEAGSPGDSGTDAVAADAWMECMDRKAELELQVRQCEAALTASQSNQELREENYEQLATNAEANADTLRQRLQLLDEHLAAAHARHTRLQAQLRQLRKLTSFQALPLGLSELPTLQPVTPANPQAAEEALRRAEASHKAAVAARREASQRSKRLAAKAACCKNVSEAEHVAVAHLNQDVTQQNVTLQRETVEAHEARTAAANAKGRVDVLREDLGRLSSQSRELFKKAFLLDHERSQSKHAYEDALVNARLASGRWQQAKNEESAARAALERLVARRLRAKWRAAASDKAQLAAADKAEQARLRLEDAEAQLAAESVRVAQARAALEEAQGQGGAAARGGGPQTLLRPSLALAMAMAAAAVFAPPTGR